MKKFEIVCRKSPNESVDPRKVIIANSDYSRYIITISFFTSNEHQHIAVNLDEDMVVMLENALKKYRSR